MNLRLSILSSNKENKAKSPAPLLPSWEKGLGDEGLLHVLTISLCRLSRLFWSHSFQCQRMDFSTGQSRVDCFVN
jgi:hypothetical protein